MSIGFGDHALDVEAQDLLQLLFPVAHVRLAGGDRRFARGDADRQDAIALRVGGRHEFGDCGEIDLERVDFEIRQTGFFGQPLRERLEVQQLLRVARVLELLVGKHNQRMMLAAIDAAIADQAVRFVAADQLIGDEIVQHAFEREPAIGGFRLRDGNRLDRCR
jgi:hypothetical protein